MPNEKYTIWMLGTPRPLIAAAKITQLLHSKEAFCLTSGGSKLNKYDSDFLSAC